MSERNIFKSHIFSEVKKETLYKNELKFKVGNTYNLEEIKKKLVELRICKARLNRRKRSF